MYNNAGLKKVAINWTDYADDIVLVETSKSAYSRWRKKLRKSLEKLDYTWTPVIIGY